MSNADTTTTASNAANLNMDEDEDECRVCRGPAEEGRPLYAPCRCSGSIGLTHQDCLSSWLSVTRGAKCELCGTPFKFAPLYAEGTPDNLPSHEVVLGVLRRAGRKWLPFVLRVVLSVTLWLFALPLATAYLYFGWIHRPYSVVHRWKLSFVAGDAVSGAVVAAVIIVSFLSFMSFADFLRIHWQQIGQIQQANMPAEANEEVGEEPEAPIRPGPPPPPPRFMRPPNPFLQDRRRDEANERDAPPAMNALFPNIPAQENNPENDDRNAGNDHILRPRQGPEVERVDAQEAREARNAARHAFRDARQRDNVDEPARNVPERVRANPPPPAEEPRRRPPMFGDDFQPQVPRAEPVADQDDPMEMEIHVALDELLGFRGPLTALFRNLMWLLAFNTTYLGLFAFVPYTVGRAVHSAVSNSTLFKIFLEHLPRLGGFSHIMFQYLESLNSESRKLNTVLQLPDITTIVLGYLSMAFMVFLWKTVALFALRMLKVGGRRRRSPRPIRRRHRDQFDGDHRLLFNEDLDNNGDGVRFSHRISVVLDCAAAIVKVGVLLFLKMLLLPLLLGVWLDIATLSLFQKTVQDRVLYAGEDIFGAMLLHWVVGITFMLLVTVSVLQLREVVHPDLLAKVIRPQEPQPDLLGNLLQESGATHAKRMFLSLAIYAVLLSVHVWLPTKFMVSSGFGNILPFFRPIMNYIIFPQFQIPIELMVFHLGMLAFLEKHKNHIGKMQHCFLVFMCERMKITDYLLPRTVGKFSLVGIKPLYLKNDSESTQDSDENPEDSPTEVSDNDDVATDVSEPSIGTNEALPPKKIIAPTQPNNNANDQLILDPFWTQLSKMKNPSDEFILQNIRCLSDTEHIQISDNGVTRRNGQRTIDGSPYILRISSPNNELVEISTSLGAYRLRRTEGHRLGNELDIDSQATVVEFWKEVVGPPISRPPEGWDDLGVGGAEVQGRWAWGSEKRSEVEESVAARIPFKSSENVCIVAIKLCALLVLSWLAILVMACCVMNVPLFVGRWFFTLLRLPERFMHDPINACIGIFVLFPVASSLSRRLGDTSAQSLIKTCHEWIVSFRLSPSFEKNRILVVTLSLWLFVLPLILGTFYRLCIMTTHNWWIQKNHLLSFHECLILWASGAELLHVWAGLCYFGAFTKNFWMSLLINLEDNNANPINNNQQRNAENQENEANNADNADNHQVPAPTWQGEEGRIANFVNTVYKILSDWEWEKVDKVILLDNCLKPITKELIVCLVGTAFVFSAILLVLRLLFYPGPNAVGMILPVIGFVEEGNRRMFCFRLSAFAVIATKLCMTFRSPLQQWFQVAHKAARDDRYRTGEVLLNFTP